jgi:TP901 family phage tail tape measure protein
MARQVASLFGVLKLDDSDYKNKLQGADRDAKSFGTTLKNQGQQLQQFGAGMTSFFAPIGVGLGYAVTQGHNFDRTFSNINSILKLGAEDAAALRAEILAFGSNTVAGPQATAEAYYEIVSGVADASTHMAILEAATRTAEAGQADLGATTSALISTMNSYGFAASDASFVSDVFSRTVAMGTQNMEQLAAAFPEVMGLGAAYGVELDELGASMAYLSTQGYTFSSSATFMKSMMTTLLNPTADLQAAITALGYESGAALLEAEGLTGAYELLAAQNGGLDGLITNTEALQGAIALTGDGAESFFTTYNEGLAGATDGALAIQNQTAQWERLKAQLDGLVIQLSDALMPTINDLVTNYISPAITAVSDWVTKNPELTTQILMITTGLVILGPVLGLIGTLLTAAGTAATALGVIFGLLSSPFVAFGLVVAGLIWMFTRPGGLIGTLQEAWTNAENLITQLNTIISLLPQMSFNGFGWGSPSTGSTGTSGGGGEGQQRGFGYQGRAGGGDVEAGQSYMVGENGPEPFIPRVSGTIIPNHELGRGGDTYNVTVNANSEEEGRNAARGFNEEMMSLKRSRGVAWANG